MFNLQDVKGEKMKRRASILITLCLILLATISFIECANGGQSNEKLKFELSVSTVTVEELSTHQITATYGGETVEGVSWSSSHPTVASVNNGLICGLTPGKATITATYNEETAICEVTVMKRGDLDVKLSTTELTIEVEERKKVNIEASVNGKVVDAEYLWSSSDKDVVNVNQNGYITANSKGDARISVEVKYDTYVKTFDINVVVISKIEITLNAQNVMLKTDAQIDKGLTSKQISATASRDGVPIENALIEYVTSKKSVCEVSNEGLIVAKGAGQATVTVKARIGDSQNTKDITVIVERSVKKLPKIEFETWGEVESGAAIYNQLTFSTFGCDKTKPEVYVYDKSGEIMFSTSAKMDGNQYAVELRERVYGDVTIEVLLTKIKLEIPATVITREIEDDEEILLACKKGDGYYKLKKDVSVTVINCREVAFERFDGVIDGNGKTLVFNITSDATSLERSACGVFSHMEGTIKNTKLYVNLSGRTNLQSGTLAERFYGSLEGCCVNYSFKKIVGSGEGSLFSEISKNAVIKDCVIETSNENELLAFKMSKDAKIKNVAFIIKQINLESQQLPQKYDYEDCVLDIENIHIYLGTIDALYGDAAYVFDQQAYISGQTDFWLKDQVVTDITFITEILKVNEISTLDQLKSALVLGVGEYRLTADIDLGTVKAALTTRPNVYDNFSGVIDGNGHKISGYFDNSGVFGAYYTGLFGEFSGEIVNLTLDIKYCSYYMEEQGAFANNFYGKLRNCIIKVNMDDKGVVGKSGFVKTMHAGSLIENCIFIQGDNCTKDAFLFGVNMNKGATLKNVLYVKDSYESSSYWPTGTNNYGLATFSNVALYTSMDNVLSGNVSHYSGTSWGETSKAYTDVVLLVSPQEVPE